MQHLRLCGGADPDQTDEEQKTFGKQSSSGPKGSGQSHCSPGSDLVHGLLLLRTRAGRPDVSLLHLQHFTR